MIAHLSQAERAICLVSGFARVPFYSLFSPLDGSDIKSIDSLDDINTAAHDRAMNQRIVLPAKAGIQCLLPTKVELLTSK